MVAPVTQKIVSSRSSQRRRKGTIASRYLEAIGIQCGANSTVNTGKKSFRSTPIDKTQNGDFDTDYYSFSKIIKNGKSALWSETVYDKINGTTNAADCSKSIITASTAVMLDHSDSISTTPTSPGGSRAGRIQRNSPHRRPKRRGRSPTANRTGTNSNSNSSSRNRTINGGSNHSTRINNHDDFNHEYVHVPGSQSTAPLSDGVVSAPSTPSRFSQRRKQQLEGKRSTTKRSNDHTSKSFSYNGGGNSSPITSMTAKSIMGINSSTSDSDCSNDNSKNPDYRFGLTRSNYALNDAQSPLSVESGHDRGNILSPRTSPRRPSDSPGPQPRSPRQNPYAQQQEQISSRSIFGETPGTTDHTQFHYLSKDAISNLSQNNPHPHRVKITVEGTPTPSPYQSEPTDSEAGAPTEIIENRRSLHRPSHLRRPSTGAGEVSSPSSPSSHYQSEPIDSESGAPTEITKNHRILRRPYHHLRRPSSGDGGNEILLKNRRSNSRSDIFSRVRNRYHNQHQEQQQQQRQQNKEQNDPGKSSMPSLLDSQSSSVSSVLPMAATQAEEAPASMLSQSPTSEPPSRLSRHVENARKQSIWSPSASETTCTPASIDNETNGLSSLTTEIGLSQDHRLGAKPLSSLLMAKVPAIETKTETPALKQGGLLRRPVGARVAALETQYRKGKLTVRGARSQKHDEFKEQQQVKYQEAEASDCEDFPDPILSASYTMDDNESHYKEKEEQANEEDDEDEDNYEDELNDSDKNLGTNSNISQDYDTYDDDGDDEESALPEYSRNQNDGGPAAAEEGETLSPVFIAYNDRQTPNTDGVFQFQSKDKVKYDKNKVKTASTSSKIRKSRGRSKGGKSPIQALFSSERLDENNMASIHESSIRSKSLGRTITSRQFMKIGDKKSNGQTHFARNNDVENTKSLPRRSKSLSERSERKYNHDHKPSFSKELSEAVKIIARERRKRSQIRLEQEAPQKPVPGNIVVKNVTSKTEDGAEVSISVSSLTQSSTPSPSQPTRPLDETKFSSSGAGASNVKSPQNREVSPMETLTSIKNKIRAFNLKKSQRTSSSTRILSPENAFVDRKPPDSVQDSSSRFDENSRGRTNMSKRTEDEKKEDGKIVERLNENYNDASAKMKRNKLERKSLWARYFIENVNDHDDDESGPGTNDDYSVQNLREQFEQKTCTSQNFVAGEDDDDDRSVKNLRDVFEPPMKKQTGEIINNLKAKYEPKPKGSRLSFAKHTQLTRKESRGIEESKLKLEWNGNVSLNDPNREELDSMEAECDGTRGSESADAQSFEWWKLKEEDSSKGDGSKNAQTTQMLKNEQGLVNEWSKRRQTERKPIRLHPEERRRNRIESNLNNGGTLSDDAKTQRAKTGVSKGNGFISTQQQIFGLVETRQAPLKDNNRKIPGSHWTSQGARSARESFSDSEYSDAVTLDPSFADVSNLSNPSAIQSPDTDRQSNASSSVLFENLETNVSHGELDGIPGASNPELALPKLNKLRRETNNPRVFSSSSDHTHRNPSLQNVTPTSRKLVMERNHTHIIKQLPHVVTPENGHTSGNRAHFSNRDDNVDHRDHGYGASVVRNDILSDSQIAVSPMHGKLHQPAHNLSSYHFTSSEDNLRKEVEYSNDSSERTNAPQHHSESSYRCSRTDTSNRYSGSPESSREEFERSYQATTQSMGKLQQEAESSNISTHSSDVLRPGLPNFHDNSTLSYRQKPNTSDSAIQKDNGSSWDESRDRNNVRRHKILVGASQPASKPPVGQPIPSPFDENYAAIMESRHKMLVVRQRALLNRRANREKIQNNQQGFFGRTNPGKIDASSSLSNRTYRDPRPLAEDQEYNETKAPEIRKTGNSSIRQETLAAHPKEGRQLRSPGANTHGPRRVNKKNEAEVHKSPVASMFSRIRPAFSAMALRDKETSQKQAVIDRISAVRAARLRRNHSYGKIESSNNYEASRAYRPEKAIPRKLKTIHDSISDPFPGYRYYPHNESGELRTREDDHSLSTHSTRSNAQDYAAELSVD